NNQAKLVLSHNPHGSVAALLDDCVACAADHLITDGGGPAWDEAGFRRLTDHVRTDLTDTAADVLAHVQRILATAHEIEPRPKSTNRPPLTPALTDVRAQLGRLVSPGFVTATGRRRLPDVLRYLRAVERRLDKLPDDPYGDRQRMQRMQQVEAAYIRARDAR